MDFYQQSALSQASAPLLATSGQHCLRRGGFPGKVSVATNARIQWKGGEGPKREYNHLPLGADGLLHNGVVWRGGRASVGDLNTLQQLLHTSLDRDARGKLQ